MMLFAQDHKDFEICCFEAQRIDDNRRGRSSVEEHKSDDSSNVRKNDEVVSHSIADRIVCLLKTRQ